MRVELLEPRGGLTAAVVESTLGLVIENPPPRSLIGRWSRLELAIVYDWAMREHLRAAGNALRRRPRPFLIGHSRVQHE